MEGRKGGRHLTRTTEGKGDGGCDRADKAGEFTGGEELNAAWMMERSSAQRRSRRSQHARRETTSCSTGKEQHLHSSLSTALI